MYICIFKQTHTHTHIHTHTHTHIHTHTHTHTCRHTSVYPARIPYDSVSSNRHSEDDKTFISDNVFEFAHSLEVRMGV